SLENTSNISSGTIVSWDWDLGNEDDVTTWNANSDYTEIGDYTVILEATSDQGCIASSSQNISIFEPAIANIEEDEIIVCSGQIAFLNAETNGSVQWTPSTGLSCTNCPNPTANPSASTTYYLETITTDGCTAQDSVFIERKSALPPVVGLTDDMSICQGEIIQLIATGGNSPFEYAWDDTVEGLTCYQFCSNPLVEIDTTSTFTVIVTDDNGCSSSESVTVEVRGSDLDILGDDRTICLGDSIQLNVSNEVSDPTWGNDSSLSCSNCPNPMATPVETMTYLVDVSFEDCPLTKEITVNVMYPDEVDAGEDVSICNGQTTELQGEAPSAFTWSNGSNTISTDDLTPEVSPSNTTEYIISISEDLCSMSDTVLVEVNNELFLEAPSVQTCVGEPVQLIANGVGVETYTWSNAESLNNPNIANPLATVTETTTFQVTGYNEYCGETTINVTVEVLDAPQIMLPEIQSYVPDSQVELNLMADNDDNYTYQWQPSTGLSCTNCQNPTATPEGEITYTVRVTNTAGCVSEATVLLRPLSDCLGDIVTVPTGFTPNQDGKNDKLHVLGIADVQLFRVYNRWGEMVFETTDATEGWDGTFKTKPLNTDVYVWYIEALCPIDGSVISKKGDVTLVR
ncbi:MAG: gliding motility-associated C-terminal domain-containing protein, partial [Saprospiraceae bacterium]